MRALCFQLSAILALAPWLAIAQPRPDELPLDPARVPAEVRPLANGDALFVYRDAFRGYAPAASGTVELRSATGVVRFERRVGLDVPNATTITILDATRLAHGEVAVSLVAAGGGATAHVLGIYPASGAPRIVKLSVACFNLAPSADGGVWCLGPDVERHNSGRLDFNVLHRFSRDGRVVTSIVAREAFSGSPRAWEGRSRVVEIGDSLVAWMAARRQLVHLTLAGQVTSATAVPPAPVAEDPRTDYVLGTDGRLRILGITSQVGAEPRSWSRSVFEFDRERERWTATRWTGMPMWIRLVAHDGQRATLWDREVPRLIRLDDPR